MRVRLPMQSNHRASDSIRLGAFCLPFGHIFNVSDRCIDSMSQGCVPARGAPTIFGWGQQCGVGACCKRGSDSDWDLPSAAILELGFRNAIISLHAEGNPIIHG